MIADRQTHTDRQTSSSQYSVRLSCTGATTAEKLETSRGDCQSLYFSSFPPLIPASHYCPTHVSPTSFHTFLSFSPSVQRGGLVCFPQCPAKHDRQLQKLEGTKYTSSPLSPKLEGTRPTGPIGRGGSRQKYLGAWPGEALPSLPLLSFPTPLPFFFPPVSLPSWDLEECCKLT